MKFDQVVPPPGRPARLTEVEWHEIWFGAAELSPRDDVIAGATGTWTLTYTVGRYGLDDSGTLKIAWRWASDWGKPQATEPTAANYVTATTSGPATLGLRFETKGFRRPWQRCLTVDVFDDSLAEGDTITIAFGDRSEGSPGMTAQTFVETSFEFKVIVDCHGAGWFAELPRNPELRVVPGPAEVLRVINPTLAVTGEPTWIGLRLEDHWGNVAAGFAGDIALRGDGLAELPATVRLDATDGGAKRVEAVAGAPGLVRVEARTGELTAVGNPLRVVAERPEFLPLWADLHGQSEETVGTNTIEDYFRFGRDKAFCDVLGHQGNDFQITAETWAELRRVVSEMQSPGRFIPLLGYEWSGTTPAGGDRNVYFPGDDGELHRSSHWLVPDRADAETDAHPVERLFESFRGQDVLIVPHVGGRYADLARHDEALEPVVEIWSAWGRFEWFRAEALSRGYRVGFTAGSDGHKGRPGASHPGSSTFGVYGGYTCILARDHSREAVWEALRARRTIAVGGVRMAIDARIGGQPPGATVAAGADDLPAEITVAGTAPIERIELFAGNEVIETYPATVTRRVGRRLRVMWSGARVRARGRMQDWTGGLTIEGARIVGVTPYAFDAPMHGVRSWDERSVTWSSITAGDDDGVVLELADVGTPRVTFQTDWCRREIVCGEAPEVRDLGGLDLRLTVEWEPEPLGDEVTWTTRLPAPTRPVGYWFRVRQSDGKEAWVTPVYVEPTTTEAKSG